MMMKRGREKAVVRSRLIVGRLWSCFEPELLSSPSSPPPPAKPPHPSTTRAIGEERGSGWDR